MKKSIFKKVGMLGLASLSLVMATSVKAEKVCTTHKNYYLYIHTDKVPNFVQNVYNTEGSKRDVYNSAYFPKLPADAMPAVGNQSFLSGRICLTKDGKTDGTGVACIKGLVWTLEEYYNALKETSENKEPITFEDENGEEVTCREYTKEAGYEDGNKVIEHYYGGTKWFNCASETCSSRTEGDDKATTARLTLEDFVKAAILPSVTDIKFAPATSTLTIVKRTYDAKKDFLDYLEYDENGEPKTDTNGNLVINENSQKFVPTKLVLSSGRDAFIAPSVYYLEYQTCEDAYKATINYYYYKDNAPTTDRVEFSNKEDNPYVKDGLLAGESVTKNSPELKGCTIVDTKGNKYDADKKVTLTIDKDNPKDVSKNVYYYCPIEDKGSEIATGDALIYLAWAIGLGAIGYSVYYFRRLKKEKI